MKVCVACGAVESGNITCPTCRDTTRREYPRLAEAMNHLDALHIPFVPPLGADDIRPFIEKLKAINS